VKTLVCNADLKRESLCSKCRKNLEEGKITELEVEVSRKLNKLNKKFFFTDLELKNAIELDGIVVLVCSGNIGSLIGKGGRIIAELSKGLGKKCRVIEKTRDEKKVVQDLIGNARISGINKLFSMGELEYVVVIEKDDEGKLICSKEVLEKGLKHILDAETKIEFS
jgi:transcription antitermination factor NusA-like protein